MIGHLTVQANKHASVVAKVVEPALFVIQSAWGCAPLLCVEAYILMFMYVGLTSDYKNTGCTKLGITLSVFTFICLQKMSDNKSALTELKQSKCMGICGFVK